jgi:hypothetical protein
MSASRSTFTAGPWIAEFGENSGYDCMTDAWHISGVVGGGWPAPIATVDLSHYGQSTRNRDIPEMSKRHAEADARLIAAAPELYAALCAMCDAKNDEEDAAAMSLTIGALAKAEGR